MKRIICFAFFLPVALFGHKALAQTHEAKEDQAIELLRALPEVKSLQAEIDSFSHHKKGASFIVEPDEEVPSLFHVTVGYNGKDRYETRYLFEVDIKTRKIGIMDVVEGDTISVEEWRDRKRERGME